jgi:hypothetical protein
LKVRKHLPHTSASHKIDGPALVHRLWRHQRNRIAHWQALFSLTAKIQFQQVNPVNALMVPALPCLRSTEKAF